MTVEALPTVRLQSNIYKGCRRCGGVLRLERDADSLVDHDAYDYVCLQCGHHTPYSVVFARLAAGSVHRA